MMAIILSSHWCSWRIVFVYDFVVSINDAHVIKPLLSSFWELPLLVVAVFCVLFNTYVMFDARSEEVVVGGGGGMMMMNDETQKLSSVTIRDPYTI